MHEPTHIIVSSFGCCQDSLGKTRESPKDKRKETDEPKETDEERKLREYQEWVGTAEEASLFGQKLREKDEKNTQSMHDPIKQELKSEKERAGGITPFTPIAYDSHNTVYPNSI